MSKKKDTNPSFEEALKELESLVESMEKDSPSLEESLKQFEKGVKLTRVCQKALSDAEQEIKLLTDNKEEDFSIDG